jgi:hypothetical protein
MLIFTEASFAWSIKDLNVEELCNYSIKIKLNEIIIS